MKALCLPRRNLSSSWVFCSSRLTFFLNWEFWMILFRAEAILASNISNFGKFGSSNDCEDYNSSNESTISTSLIHNIASDGKSEQVVTWLLNPIFQYKNVKDVRNLSKCSSGICCLCCPTIEFCGTFTGNNELIVDGFLTTVGTGIVPFCQIVTTCARISRPNVHWNRSCSTKCRRVKNSLKMISG